MAAPDDEKILPVDAGSDVVTQEAPEKAADNEPAPDGSPYPQGIRFWLITIGMSLGLFLTNLEIPIVTTSVVAITEDIGGFENAGWFISSYLLGFVGVVVIFAKLSDIFGRKPILATAISIFVVASAACGGAQTPAQLIVFRLFQGMGGGGCFSLGITMITDLVPPAKWAQFGANIAVVYALALLVGPILGGAISEHTTWRWVFLLNIPPGIVALVLTLTAIPKGFPARRPQGPVPRTFGKIFSGELYKRIDFLGGVLLLLASTSLTAGFQEAGSTFPWRSAYVITLLIASGLLWIALILWERYVTLADSLREPVMPWVFLTDRSVLGLLMDSAFLGGTWFVGVFTLPQKFQLVHGSSPLWAGVQTMPFTFAAPFGAAFSSVAAGKWKLPVVVVLLLSAILQVLGFVLLATLPDETFTIPARSYGFQIIAGFGCGINISLPALVIPFLVQPKHRAVGMGAVGQVRIMGGSIVLSIATSVFHSYTRSRLQALIGRTDISLANKEDLAAVRRDDVRGVLAHGYNLQLFVLVAFAAAQILVTLLMWKKKQVRI